MHNYKNVQTGQVISATDFMSLTKSRNEWAVSDEPVNAKVETIVSPATPAAEFPEFPVNEDLNHDQPTIDHVVTEDDLKDNPSLVEEGVQEGETIQVPAPVIEDGIPGTEPEVDPAA